MTQMQTALVCSGVCLRRCLCSLSSSLQSGDFLCLTRRSLKWLSISWLKMKTGSWISHSLQIFPTFASLQHFLPALGKFISGNEDPPGLIATQVRRLKWGGGREWRGRSRNSDCVPLHPQIVGSKPINCKRTDFAWSLECIQMNTHNWCWICPHWYSKKGQFGAQSD